MHVWPLPPESASPHSTEIKLEFTMQTKFTLVQAGAAVAAALLLALCPAGAFAQSTSPKITKKVPMEFPAEATRKGVDKGVLKARVTIDGAGVPTEVAILDVQPNKARILNESVIATLNNWRFEGAGKATTFEMQVVMTAE
jgi:periplasmic protein TonB